jgi:UDP-glucose 4-epimerase
MEAMKQAILVTGGAGYVGAHACKALAFVFCARQTN